VKTIVRESKRCNTVSIPMSIGETLHYFVGVVVIERELPILLSCCDQSHIGVGSYFVDLSQDGVEMSWLIQLECIGDHACLGVEEHKTRTPESTCKLVDLCFQPTTRGGSVRLGLRGRRLLLGRRA
jgi:hypothetical protein